MHKLYGNNIRLTRGDTLAVAASKFRLVGKVYRVEKEDAAEAMYREFYERDNAEQ